MGKKIADIIILGFAVEIFKDMPRDTPYPEGHWLGYKIYIYDCVGDASEKEIKKIVEYLYEEGFIQDRRTEYTVLRGEDLI